MPFIARDSVGRYDLDPDEPPYATWELRRAEKWLEGWTFARRPYGKAEAGPCPHEEDFCVDREQCIKRVAWWFRYIREIEGIA